MLEGGGRTPILNPLELEELGYKLVAYPLSLIGVSIQAMQVIFLNLCKKDSSCLKTLIKPFSFDELQWESLISIC